MFKCCNLILHGLCFFDGSVVACCYAPMDQFNNVYPPLIFKDYNGEMITKEELFSKTRPYVEQFKAGQIPRECQNCFQIEEKEWDESEYIDFITITHYTACNANCIYCSNNLKPEERKPTSYKIIPLLRSFKEQGILKKGCEFHMGGGEFSIYEEADEILEEFAVTNYAKMYIATNAIKYLDSIFKGMDNECCMIFVSLDSGSRETFKRIKRVDAFDTVISNLKNYTKTDTAAKRLFLKYILIPGYNDKLEEFGKFLQIAHELKAEQINIDIEARYAKLVNYKIHDCYVSLLYQMQQKGKEEGFKVYFHSFLEQTMHSMNTKDIPIVANECHCLPEDEKIQIANLYESYLYGNRLQ
ncbi:MAG: radical SAM protein [Candidatus Gastranaerophilaceae bacterium]